ncbi:MAG: hypothetical protein QG626_662 [Patescibacteria group bacterium]|jgi:hypothetical protein|nr:hypothetical protein [Patescibacteria group bacterium]
MDHRSHGGNHPWNNFHKIVLGISVIVILLTAIPFSINPIRAAFLRYEVQGEVLDAPKGKTFGNAASGITTEFSVRLRIGDEERIVNCASTPCASLTPGDNVVLSCFEEWYLSAPNEEECQYDRLQ